MKGVVHVHVRAHGLVRRVMCGKGRGCGGPAGAAAGGSFVGEELAGDAVVMVVAAGGVACAVAAMSFAVAAAPAVADGPGSAVMQVVAETAVEIA